MNNHRLLKGSFHRVIIIIIIIIIIIVITVVVVVIIIIVTIFLRLYSRSHRTRHIRSLVSGHIGCPEPEKEALPHEPALVGPTIKHTAVSNTHKA
jgi:flagellar basal body-associated protein FliL